jgi:hypothetical protein
LTYLFLSFRPSLNGGAPPGKNSKSVLPVVPDLLEQGLFFLAELRLA